MVDAPDAIRKKFKTAVTDSGREVRYDPEEKPGVSNLLEIMTVATGEPIDGARATLRRRRLRRLQGGGRRGGRRAARADPGALSRRCAADERELQRLLAVGAEKARRASEPTLEAMYERMGFVKAEAGRLFGAARPRGL